jgi:sugar diacid utilization regulator
MTAVKTLLDLPGLGLRLRSGADLLDREVTRIYGTELPDPGRYLASGELVLSGLLWWRGPGDAEPFVAALVQAGAAALAASGADSGGIPQDLVDACARHRIPLLEVPLDVSFSLVTERIVLALAGGSGARRRLLSLATENAPVPTLLTYGSAELGAPCWVVSGTGRLVAGTVPDVTGHTSLRVGGSNPVPWTLLIGAELDAAALGIAEELAGVIGLTRSRDEQLQRADHAGETLMRLLGDGTATGSELATAFTACGFPADASVRVLLARTMDVDAGTELLTELLADHPLRTVVGKVGEDACALVEAGSQWPSDWTSKAFTALSTVDRVLGASRLLVGSGGPASVAGLRGACEEARHALVAATNRIGRVAVVSGEEIGVHRLLLAGAPDELRAALRERVLGPLLAYDSEQHGDLVRSVRVFLECSGSPARAAKALHVHVNTLRYRITRASEILDADLTDFGTQVDVYLALMVEG